MTLDLVAAKNFLRNYMYNSTDKMVRESTKPTGNNYYVNSANGLYYTVMRQWDSNNAAQVLTQTVKTKKQCCRGNITIYTMWFDVMDSLWTGSTKTEYDFRGAPDDENWMPLTYGYISNNNSTAGLKDENDIEINAKCLFCINAMRDYYRTGVEATKTYAQGIWQDTLDLFDDAAGGYKDDILAYRETYKQGLVKMASKFPELASVGTYQETSGMWDGNLQDPITGGIYARYTKSGGIVNNNGDTFENTEATTAIILGYDNYNNWLQV